MIVLLVGLDRRGVAGQRPRAVQEPRHLLIDVEGGRRRCRSRRQASRCSYDAGFAPNAMNDRDGEADRRGGAGGSAQEDRLLRLEPLPRRITSAASALAKMIPDWTLCFDHGETVEDVDRPRLTLYRAGCRTCTDDAVKPGT